MASDDDSQALDTHHDDKDWEEQKENFRICYIDRNMTRKEAAEYMKQHHDFNATPRQWERKIKQWGFSKYTGRDERLAQIAQSGKTVLDVSRPGRRPRSLVDERGNLQPHEDRNLRRFARREVSRSRSRSRSASFADRPRPQFKQEFSDPSAASSLDPAFSFNDLSSEMRRTPSREGLITSRMQGSREMSEPLQPNFLQNQQAVAYEAPDDRSIAVGMPSQYQQGHPHSSPPFNTVPAQTQFSTFVHGPIPLHASHGMGLANSNQTFSGNSTDSSFGYPMQEPIMQPIPTGFNQYGMHPSMLPEGIMTEQAIFDSGLTLQQGPDALDQAGFENHPMITFDIVDTDTPAMMPVSEPAPVQSQPPMSASFPETPLSDSGSLGRDVLPLVEQYIRAVQNVALNALPRSTHAEEFSERLAADLVQPSSAFMASMAIFLDNFDKTKQRSLQSMKDTCSKLRQKNAMLEQVLNGRKFSIVPP
ncbi:hypothetical protein G647_09833 [Cladophialophora carrionii CBS 160.54]|uniref:Clr5 domain-containing protein n=1 Tax=Cladophialophora carrionii CBS 160.54 TaxID=1279043 RepID=V9DKC7_9EURO|nr:uncharacterized protein G647_09833 [Cladophialophora carrionii CBS 160.54]ETI27151.1 hypothetical protein G647_09833 [Cladophialophora carrionii CBS 160.54]